VKSKAPEQLPYLYAFLYLSFQKEAKKAMNGRFLSTFSRKSGRAWGETRANLTHFEFHTEHIMKA